MSLPLAYWKPNLKLFVSHTVRCASSVSQSISCMQMCRHWGWEGVCAPLIREGHAVESRAPWVGSSPLVSAYAMPSVAA